MGPDSDPLSESTARNYFRDVVLGIEYCEYINIESEPLYLKAE